ncbi:hypothetical protein QE381_003283 [Microbacterium sp. SORGH_AS 888]|nr:hypothetical protein [Microbacterium sp. SORGH_AS_0888]
MRRHAVDISRRLRITDVYAGAEGWRPAERGLCLAPDTASQLRALGYSIVRVRIGWWRRKEVSLFRYLERHTGRGSNHRSGSDGHHEQR